MMLPELVVAQASLVAAVQGLVAQASLVAFQGLGTWSSSAGNVPSASEVPSRWHPRRLVANLVVGCSTPADEHIQMLKHHEQRLDL